MCSAKRHVHFSPKSGHGCLLQFTPSRPIPNTRLSPPPDSAAVIAKSGHDTHRLMSALVQKRTSAAFGGCLSRFQVDDQIEFWRAVPRADRALALFNIRSTMHRRVYGPTLELLNANRLLGTGISSWWRTDVSNHDLDCSYLDSVLEIMHRTKGSLLDHLIGASKERWRDRHT